MQDILVAVIVAVSGLFGAGTPVTMELIIGLGAVILTVIGTTAGFSFWIKTWMHKVERRLERMEGAQWAAADMRSWARQLKEKNEGLVVPSVTDVLEGHTV